MTHRKFHRFTRSVGSIALARGILEVLWDGCYESGDDYLGTAADIDQRIGWSGQPGEVALALVACGFPEGHGFIEPMQGEDGGEATYRVHDLWHHAPDYVQKRHQREMARRQKQEPTLPVRHSAPNGEHWTVTPGCSSGVDRTPAPAPARAPAPAQKDGSAEPLNGSTPDAVGTAMTFDTVGGNPTWALTEALLAKWQSEYSTLDIARECRRARTWLEANPRRRKTSRGMPAFLVNWFNRATDSGRGHQYPADSSAVEKPDKRGHLPPCRTNTECNRKLEQEIAARKGAAG